MSLKLADIWANQSDLDEDSYRVLVNQNDYLRIHNRYGDLVKIEIKNDSRIFDWIINRNAEHWIDSDGEQVWLMFKYLDDAILFKLMV